MITTIDVANHHPSLRSSAIMRIWFYNRKREVEFIRDFLSFFNYPILIYIDTNISFSFSMMKNKKYITFELIIPLCYIFFFISNVRSNIIRI